MKHEGRGVIRIGDKTDHGGQVISASSGTRVMGRFAALADDETFCPACKGKFPIKPDGSGAKHMGRSYAYHQDKTACGALLISSLDYPDSVAIDSPVADAGSAAPAIAQFDEAIQALDKSTNKPIPGLPYRIEMSDGTILRGVTDSNGMTMRPVTGQQAIVLKLFWETDCEANGDN